MLKYNTIIFDLDGTLLDTLEDLTDAVNYALCTNGMPIRTIEEIRRFVGNGIAKLMMRAIPDGKDNTAYDKTFAAFKEYYGKHCNDKTRPYKGVLELLKELKQKGCQLAIVSNKADFAVKELQKIYFEKYVPVAIGEKEGIKKKPAPDTVFQALKELKSDTATAIYIGDSDVDIATAKNAGLPCISVSWGFRDIEFLKEHGAEIIADTTKEVMDYLHSNRPEAPHGNTRPLDDTGRPTSSAQTIPL